MHLELNFRRKDHLCLWGGSTASSHFLPWPQLVFSMQDIYMDPIGHVKCWYLFQVVCFFLIPASPHSLSCRMFVVFSRNVCVSILQANNRRGIMVSLGVRWFQRLLFGSCHRPPILEELISFDQDMFQMGDSTTK